MRTSEQRVGRYFIRNGYVRVARESLRRTRGAAYKKGCEVRIVVESVQECNEVRNLLIEAGIKPGRAFTKHSRIVQPVYGAESMAKILSWARKLPKASAKRKSDSGVGRAAGI